MKTLTTQPETMNEMSARLAVEKSRLKSDPAYRQDWCRHKMMFIGRYIERTLLAADYADMLHALWVVWNHADNDIRMAMENPDDYAP